MKEQAISIDWLTTVTSLAYSYGPCVFALIFRFFVCRWANQIYVECQVRVLPASPGDKAVYKYSLIGACVTTALLVVASIPWFIFI